MFPSEHVVVRPQCSGRALISCLGVRYLPTCIWVGSLFFSTRIAIRCIFAFVHWRHCPVTLLIGCRSFSEVRFKMSGKVEVQNKGRYGKREVKA